MKRGLGPLKTGFLKDRSGNFAPQHPPPWGEISPKSVSKTSVKNLDPTCLGHARRHQRTRSNGGILPPLGRKSTPGEGRTWPSSSSTKKANSPASTSAGAGSATPAPSVPPRLGSPAMHPPAAPRTVPRFQAHPRPPPGRNHRCLRQQSRRPGDRPTHHRPLHGPPDEGDANAIPAPLPGAAGKGYPSAEIRRVLTRSPGAAPTLRAKAAPGIR